MDGDFSKIFEEWDDWKIKEAKLPPEQRKKCGFCFYFCPDSLMMHTMSFVVGGEDGVCLLEKSRVHYQTPSCSKFRMLSSLHDLSDPEYYRLMDEVRREGYQPLGQELVNKMRDEAKRRGINLNSTLIVKYKIPDEGSHQPNISRMNPPIDLQKIIETNFQKIFETNLQKIREIIPPISKDQSDPEILMKPQKSPSEKNKVRGKRKDQLKLGENISHAIALKDSGKVHESIEYCEKILELDPLNYKILSLLGELYVEIGEYLKADECFKQIKK